MAEDSAAMASEEPSPVLTQTSSETQAVTRQIHFIQSSGPVPEQSQHVAQTSTPTVATVETPPQETAAILVSPSNASLPDLGAAINDPTVDQEVPAAETGARPRTESNGSEALRGLPDWEFRPGPERNNDLPVHWSEDSTWPDDILLVPDAVASQSDSTTEPENKSQVVDQVPDWVNLEDDVTTPDDEEMKEIEANEHEISALDVPALEKKIYTDVSDPEYRPVKKVRLSWVIKGVRGTKEQPNYALMINSPYAEVDGNYWQIKFYPRGNKCSSLSAYIKCTRKPPSPDRVVPESTFSYFECAPEEDMGQNIMPTKVTRICSSIPQAGSAESSEVELSKKPTNYTTSTDTATASSTMEWAQRLISSHGELPEDEEEEDWRVSAQLGMVIYNPAEPRTNTYSSSEHQFNKHNDDWGWTNFVGPWREIQIRNRGQRKPLLQNDTIAIDAYIQVFEDPTKMLWWHTSLDSEVQWDAKSLTGYFPMGTPPLYHSPAVAGLSAWLLLKPFRDVLQGVDVSRWKSDSRALPRPFICRLQVILYLMRTLKREEHYVNVMPILEAMRDAGENYVDVKSFWEAFRRSVELEIEDENDLLQNISDILDPRGTNIELGSLPVKGVSDVQSSINLMMRKTSFHGSLPNFLPLLLERETFDASLREWKLHYDRVAFNDEIDVSEFCTDSDPAKFTLYGFMVHVGERNSGKFYCVIRPGGPATKWLAFEDGESNKMFSYTKRRIQDFEGLEGDELRQFRSTRQTAYMVMYIRNSRFKEYLPDALEPYPLPTWLKAHIDTAYHNDDVDDDPEVDSVGSKDTESEIDVEIYLDESAVGKPGLLDMFNLKQDLKNPRHLHHLKFPRDATVQAVRQEVATRLGLDQTRKIRLFVMSFTGTGAYTSAQFLNAKPAHRLNSYIEHAKPLCFWMCQLKTEDEIRHFSYADPIKPCPSAKAGEPEGIHLLPPLGGPVETHIPGPTTPGQPADPDEEQQSVRESVAITLESIAASTAERETSAGAAEAGDSLAEERLQEPTSDSTDADPAPVVHGHLVDTLDQPTEGSDLEREDETTSRWTSHIRYPFHLPDGGTANEYDVAGSVSSESSADLSEHWSADQPDFAVSRPVKNVYGFVQRFDVDEQEFYVQSTFFARLDSRVYEAMRSCFGYGGDREFYVWHRETPLDGSLVSQLATFRDIGFNDGVDLVVGDILSAEKVEELQIVGKYSDPFALSRFHRMRARKHPIAGCVSAEKLLIHDFGSDYYLGPILNGRPHGEKGLRITANGQTYEGPLVCDQRSGHGGKMMYQNGDRYEGDWKSDERHGQGEMIEGRSGNRYVGGFENGKRWGKGVTYWNMADEEAGLCKICYTEEIDALFFDCGHVCSCVECAKQCDICPMCRRTVREVVKMYRA